FYRCPNSFSNRLRPRSCPQKELRAETLELGVWNRVKTMLQSPELIIREFRTQRDETSNLSEEILALQSSLKKIEDQEQRIARLYVLGTLDDAVLERESSVVKRQKDAAKRDLQALLNQRQSLAEMESREEDAVAFCQRMAQGVERFGFDEQRLSL